MGNFVALPFRSTIRQRTQRLRAVIASGSAGLRETRLRHRAEHVRASTRSRLIGCPQPSHERSSMLPILPDVTDKWLDYTEVEGAGNREALRGDLPRWGSKMNQDEVLRRCGRDQPALICGITARVDSG